MNNFGVFLQRLLKNPSQETIICVGGKKKKIKAMARYTSVNYRGDEYIKIVFDDHSLMLVIPSAKEIYYAAGVIGRAKGIPDQAIGRKEIIHHRGKTYRLDNKNDYQFRLQLYVGTPLDIEGECRFSDYLPIEGPKEFLSLGWLSYNGKRADINPQIISHKEIEI